MTREFAEGKLQAFYDNFVAHDERLATMLQPDPEMQDIVAKLEEFPTTKDSHGAYLAYSKDALKAVLFWKNGADPVGVLTALYINLGIALP